MLVTEITNEQKLELFDKYFPGMLKIFLKVAEDQGYKADVINQYEIADEMLCKCQETEFMEGVVESIEDSVSMEQYGFELTETGDEEE